MSDSGYILLHRKLWENPVLCTGERFNRAAAWIWLLTHASYKDQTLTVRGKTLKIQRGQLLVSARKLAGIWGWDKETVIRTLKCMEFEKMVTLTRTPNGTLVTIENYSKYQRFSDREKSDPYTEPYTHPYTYPDTDPYTDPDKYNKYNTYKTLENIKNKNTRACARDGQVIE